MARTSGARDEGGRWRPPDSDGPVAGGSLLGGLPAGRWGLRTSLLLTAVALALSPLFMALSPLARLGKTLPAEHQPAFVPPGERRTGP